MTRKLYFYFYFYFPVLLQTLHTRFLTRVCWCRRVCKPGTLDPAKVRGRILVCLRSDKLESVREVEQGKLAGAVIVFVQNDEQSGNLLLAENQVLPAASISGTAATYMNTSTDKATVNTTATTK